MEIGRLNLALAEARADLESMRALAARKIGEAIDSCAALEGQSITDPNYRDILERVMGIAT